MRTSELVDFSQKTQRNRYEAGSNASMHVSFLSEILDATLFSLHRGIIDFVLLIQQHESVD
jgi:hypothetical protein